MLYILTNFVNFVSVKGIKISRKLSIDLAIKQTNVVGMPNEQ